MPGFAPLRRLPLLLLLLALLAAHSSADEAPCRSLLAYVQPCASLPAFAAPVDTTQLACAASAVTDPASAQSFTLAWAIAPLLQKDHMLLGVQLDEGTSWAAGGQLVTAVRARALWLCSGWPPAVGSLPHCPRPRPCLHSRLPPVRLPTRGAAAGWRHGPAL